MAEPVAHSPQAFTRYVRGLVLLGVVLSAAILHKLAAPLADGTVADLWRPLGGDFLNYWAAPQLSPLELFPYTHYMDALHRLYPWPIYDHNWSYPLHLLFFLLPFGALPYLLALALWSLVGVALFCWTGTRLLPPHHRFIGAAALIFSPVSWMVVSTGQNGFFTGAAAIAVLLLMMRNRPWAAGLLLGCLTVKPHLFLLWLLMLLALRAWRVIAAAAFSTAVLVALSLIVHGVEAWQQYLAHVPEMQTMLLTILPNEHRMAYYTYHLMMVGLPVPLGIAGVWPAVSWLMQALLTLGVAVTTFYAFRRPLPLAHRLLLLASGGLLATPYAFNYDMTLLTAALLYYWVQHTPQTVWARWIHGAGFLLPVLVYQSNLHGVPLVSLVLLCLFATAARPAFQR